MPDELVYFYFGRQCPGRYMGEQAQQAAELLGCSYKEIDLSDRHDLAEQHGLFFPGTIMIDDLQLVYQGRPSRSWPATADELLCQAYRTITRCRRDRSRALRL